MSTVEDLNWSHHATPPQSHQNQTISNKQYPKTLPENVFLNASFLLHFQRFKEQFHIPPPPGVEPGNLNFKQTQAGDRGGWRRWVRAHKEDQKSETKAEAPGGGGRSPGEKARPNLCGGPLNSPAWPWQPGSRCLLKGWGQGSNLTSRATLCLCQWTSIFGDRFPGAVTGLQTLTGVYCEKTVYTSDCILWEGAILGSFVGACTEIPGWQAHDF